MKIAVVVETEVTSGGGFNQSLNAILQIERIAPDDVALIVVRHRSTFEVLRPMVRTRLVHYRKKPGDWLMAGFVRLDTNGELQRRLRRISPFERFLIQRHIDLAYFVNPSSMALLLQRLNIITTVWDASHRDSPEFPEGRANGEFKWRDYMLDKTLPQSLAVLTDSNALADRLSASFGTDRSRFIAMPFSAAPHLEAAGVGIGPNSPVSATDGYFYYPAQFWPHKNHIRLLQALCILRDRGVKRSLVLSGGDKGALAHIRAEVTRLGIHNQVKILGFVPPEEMVTLYSKAAVVVVPTYFGPTNLPPLEAWTMQRPLVCSSIMAEQVGDAALIFDPDNPEELADAMAEALKAETATKLIRNGVKRKGELAAERSAAEAQLSKCLKSFARRCECWKS